MEIIYKIIIEILRYVKQPYAIAGLLCLLVIYLIIRFHVIPPPDWLSKCVKTLRVTETKKIVVVIILILLLPIIVALLLHDISERIKYRKPIIVVKNEPQKKLHNCVSVKLIEVTSLQNQSYNKRLGSAEVLENLYEYIFEKASIMDAKEKAREAVSMTEEQWHQFLEGQPQYERMQITKIPFAEFRIYIDSEEIPYYQDRYFFGRQVVEVKKEGKAKPIVKFRINRIFDTIEPYQDELETTIIQVVR